MKLNPEIIKKLREQTGAGVMDVKSALEAAQGDAKKAESILRRQGQTKAAARGQRATSAGMVDAYLHLDRVGVLVEVGCETDFVARTKEFREFTHEIALQVASMKPLYIGVDDIPKAEIKQASKEETEKFYQQVCLLKQLSIKEPDLTIEDKLKDLVGRLGENIVIRRFVRYELGQPE